MALIFKEQKVQLEIQFSLFVSLLTNPNHIHIPQTSFTDFIVPVKTTTKQNKKLK